MVKARGSKGADWLARERGLVRPRFTTSCAKLFEEKGDPWLTDREQGTDYPLNRSREGDKALTADQARRAEIYENARSQLEKAGVEVPKPVSRARRPSLVVDPDMDMFTKAEKARIREPYVDPKGTPATLDHARWRANLLRKTRMAMSATMVEVKDKPRKREKIRGGFYWFNSPERKK